MGKSNRNPPKDFTYSYELSSDVVRHKYVLQQLGGVSPLITTTTSSLTALPTAVQGQVDVIRLNDGDTIEYFQSTAQTLQPTMNATKGLVIDGDQVDNETQELVPGGNSTLSPFAMVVGTDSDFFFRARFEITVTNGSDQLLVGWRKQQTYAVPASFLTGGAATYTDFAAIGFAATVATPNPVNICTSVGNAANVVTPVNFTWASTVTHELEVRVVGGKAVYLINGVRVGNPIAKDALGGAITSQSTVSAPAYTFTAALTLVPFIFVRQDAGLTTAVFLKEYEVGHLTQRGLDPNNE